MTVERLLVSASERTVSQVPDRQRRGRVFTERRVISASRRVRIAARASSPSPILSQITSAITLTSLVDSPSPDS
jgi:hypothetical protein